MSSWFSDWAISSKAAKGIVAVTKAVKTYVSSFNNLDFSSKIKKLFGDTKTGLGILWNGNGKTVSVPEIMSNQRATTLVNAYLASGVANYSDFAALDQSREYTTDELSALKEYTSKNGNRELTNQGLAQTSVRLNAEAARQASSITTTGLKGVFKSALGTVGSMALNMGAAMLVSEGISLVINKISDEINKWDNASSAGAEARKNIKDYQSAYNEKKTFNEEKGDRLIELRRGVNTTNNKNISLTNDEYSEYISLCNEIASIYPSVVSAWDSQGNAIVNLGTNAEEAKAKLDSLLESAEKATDYNVRGELNESTKGHIADLHTLQGQLDKQEKTDEKYRTMANSADLDAINNLKAQLKERIQQASKNGDGYFSLDVAKDDFSKESLEKLKNAFAEHNYSGGISGSYLGLGDTKNNTLSISGLPSDEELDTIFSEWQSQVRSKADGANFKWQEGIGQENSYKQQIQDTVNAIAEDATTALNTSQSFKQFPEALQDLLRGSMTKLDWASITDDNLNFEIEGWVDQNILQPLTSIVDRPDVQTAFNRLQNVYEKQGIMPLEDYINETDKQVEALHTAVLDSGL